MEEKLLYTMELRVISCENLSINGRLLSRKNTFVRVGTDPLNCQATKINTEGGSHPTWDEKLFIQASAREPFITLDVLFKSGSGNGERIVGTARMPTTDFMGGYLPENYLSFLSYRLKDTKGQRNGIINVSVRLKGLPEEHNLSSPVKKMKKKQPQSTVDNNECSTSRPEALATVSNVGRERMFDGSVVTGIPVNWCTADRRQYYG